jgi:hypothetical protein
VAEFEESERVDNILDFKQLGRIFKAWKDQLHPSGEKKN